MATTKLKFRNSTTLEKDGRLYFQIIHKRVVRQVATDCCVSTDEWDDKEDCLIVAPKASTTRQRVLNNMAEELRRQQEKLMKIVKSLDESGKDYTADDIVVEYEKTYRSKESVFSFFRQHISMLNEAGRHSTADRYRQALNSFKSFREGCDLHFDNYCCPLNMQSQFEPIVVQ